MLIKVFAFVCCIVAVLSACSSVPSEQTIPATADLPKSSNSNKNGRLFSLDFQVQLSEEAVKLSMRQHKLYQLAEGYKSRDKAVPNDLLQAIKEAESRQTEIANQLFMASGSLRLDTRRPGEFKDYISDCLNRINQAMQSENREVRSRFLGKSGSVTVYLAANGKIESVVPYTTSDNKEFGNYLHDLIWKVPGFPRIPQLKSRQIEQVVISFAFTLENKD